MNRAFTGVLATIGLAFAGIGLWIASKDRVDPGIYYDERGWRRDSVELTADFQNVERKVEERINRLQKEADVHPKAIPAWRMAEKKRILSDEYGIDWRTPLELDPHLTIN